MANLNSLAALAALGYMAQRGFGGDKPAPAVAATGTTAPAMPAMPAAQDMPLITDDMRQRAIDEGNKISEGERVSTYKPNPYDVEDARTVSNVRNASSSKPAAKKVQANPRDRELNMDRGPALADQKPTSSDTPPVARYTYNDIPTGGYPTVTGGERIDSTEFGRNVNNMLTASAGMTGAGAIGPALRSLQNAGMYSKVGAQPGMAQKAISAVERQALSNNPTRQITGPSKTELMARDRAARASGRNEEMLRENARRSGLDPDNINPAIAQKIRENMGGSDFSLPMKRGGKVNSTKKMAKGGMTSTVSSASKRADGIASKGKTRCKIC